MDAQDYSTFMAKHRKTHGYVAKRSPSQGELASENLKFRLPDPHTANRKLNLSPREGPRFKIVY